MTNNRVLLISIKKISPFDPPFEWAVWPFLPNFVLAYGSSPYLRNYIEEDGVWIPDRGRKSHPAVAQIKSPGQSGGRPTTKNHAVKL
jgi:hypothetical protein